MVSTAKVIAIAEICVYVPVFLLVLIVVFRHGHQKQLGWIYLAIFAAVRLAGAGFKIESISHPTNSSDVEWAAILQSVGISPLLMASLGLLKRVTDEVSNHVRSSSNSSQGYGLQNLVAASGVLSRGQKIITKRATANSRRSRVIQIAQLPTTIALILCIVGGTDQSDSNPSDITQGKHLTKIGIVIFVVIYALLFGLVVITMKDVGNAPHGEKRIYFAVMAALPLIAVRILWSVLAAFKDDSTFSVIGGKPLVQLFLATIEEFVVVGMYTLAGLTVPT